MGILDELLQAIPEEKENDTATPPPAAKASKGEAEGKGEQEEKNDWYSDDFKEYANIS